MGKLSNQAGIIHTLPLLIIIAAVGIISFLLISSTAPLNGIFGVLNPKPSSHAQEMMMAMQDNCKFLTAPGALPAFCDTFDTIHQGGRSGDLDPAKWSFSRTTAEENQPQGQFYEFYPAISQFCPNIITGVLPPKDSFICGTQFDEPNHWMTTMNDGGQPVQISGRALQPFDFTNRIGTISFDVDAKTAGSHTWWPEIWITDQPEPGPHLDFAGMGGQMPRNGVLVHLGDSACIYENGNFEKYGSGFTPTDQTVGKNGVAEIDVFNNYVATFGTGATTLQYDQNPCFATQSDHANHFEIKLSQNRIEVWVSDLSPDHGMTLPNFQRRAVLDNINLPFTKGYVTFQHDQYNASKESEPGGCLTDINNPGNCTLYISPNQTYHWHAISFDGPVLPSLRAYQVPDSLSSRNDARGGVNVGYHLDTSGLKFTLGNVDLSNATKSFLTLNYVDENIPAGPFQYRFNNGIWRIFNNPVLPFAHGGSNSAVVPLNMSDLVNGTNLLELKIAQNSLSVANIDLLIEPSIVTATPTQIPSMTPSPSGCSKVGDINCDGAINIFDYNILISNFGESGTSIQGDLNNDGIINIFDYNILIGNFGK